MRLTQHMNICIRYTTQSNIFRQAPTYTRDATMFVFMILCLHFYVVRTYIIKWLIPVSLNIMVVKRAGQEHRGHVQVQSTQEKIARYEIN